MRNYPAKGYFRFFYLLVNHRPSGMGFWIRSGSIIKKDGRRYKQLWFSLFNPHSADENFGIKRVIHDNSNKEEDIMKTLSMDDSINGAGKRIKWSIGLRPVSVLYHHFPKIFYTLPFPRTKVISYPSVLVNGRIELNGNIFDLKDEKGCLGSIWGSGYEKGWVYFHCNSFESSEGAFVEGAAGGLFVSSHLLMSAFLFSISVNEGSFKFKRLRDLFFNRCIWRKGRIDFWRRGIYTRIYGELRCRDQDIIGAIYDDVDDTYVYCYHTEVGACNITVEKRDSVFSPWNTVYTLSSRGFCHFEYGSRVKEKSIKYVYELEDSG